MTTRLNEKNVLDKKKEISFLKDRLEDLKVTREGRNTPLWKLIGPRISKASEQSKEKALAILARPDGLESTDYPKARLEAGIHFALDMVVGDIDHAEEREDKIRERIAVLENTLAEAKTHQGVV